MTMTDQLLTVDVSAVDWALLRRQKRALIDLVHFKAATKNTCEHAEGLIHFLDHIQDTVAEQLGELGDLEVFGPPNET